MGTWKLNEAKSKLVAGDGQEHQVIYTEKKDKMKVTVDGVDKDGKPTHSVWVGKVDGKAYKRRGICLGTPAAYKVVNDRTYDITAMKDGKMVWSGQEHGVERMANRARSTFNGTDADGKKFKGKAVYDKA